VNVNVANRQITVNIQHRRDLLRPRLRARSENTLVRGIAETSGTSTGSFCVKPWFVFNIILSLQATCDVCVVGEVFIANGQVTPFAAAQVGMQFIIKPSNLQNAFAPGQFYAIRMPDNQGGSDYRTNIATCSSNVVYCSQVYGVEPGNKIGPTVQGVEDLCGPTPDVYVDVG
jgi:hypothetical protein